MRYGPNDVFWVVTDPREGNSEADICFETSLAGLERHFRGGLTAEQNPTLFTEEREARIEALGRMVAMRAAQEIRRQVAEGRSVEHAERVEIRDGEGRVLFAAALPPRPRGRGSSR